MQRVRAAETSRVVMKFGGSSVADPEKVRHVARRIVAAKEGGAQVVGTVSAMGKTTDSLIALAHDVSPAPNVRELDMLLSTGERIACALVAMAIHDLGHEAVSLTGSQAGILTDSSHTRAKIREIRADRIEAALARREDRAGRRLPGVLARDDGRDHARPRRHRRDGSRTRGRSRRGLRDLLRRARRLHRRPRIVPSARKLAAISYEEMLEMSASGAKVLMLRSVELARSHGVRVHARSTFSDEPGTWIQENAGMEQPIVSAVTHNESEVVFTLTGIPDRPGAAATVFDAAAAAHVNVDTIIQNVVHGVAELSFSVPSEDVPSTRLAIEAATAQLGPMDVEENHELGKVSLIGAGMRSHPGVAAKMFRTLADLGINLEMISTSPIKISCMIGRGEIPRAVQALHAAFELEREPFAE